MKHTQWGIILLALGTGWIMSPLNGLLHSLAVLPMVGGFLLMIRGVLDLKFGERMELIKYTFLMFVAGWIPYGIVAYPQHPIAAQAGALIDDPWLVAIYFGLGFSGIVAALLLVLGNVVETGVLFLQSDDQGPPGPDEL